MSVISKNFHASGLFPYPSKGIFYGTLSQVPFKIDKESVFPASVFNGTAFYLCHVKVVIDKVRENIIQRTALMGQFDTDAYLFGIGSEYFSV